MASTDPPSPSGSQENLVQKADDNDTTVVITTPTVYTRRWYIIIVFGALACVQGALLVVWLVTAESCEAAFGWTNADLSFMSMWTYITYILGIAPFMWFMQNKGLRFSVVTAAVLVFLGALCRIITTSPPAVTWLAHFGQIFIGLAGPILFCGSPLVSAAWFPPEQRSRATAIGTVLGNGGYAVVFILDPYIVPSPVRWTNGTSSHVTNISEMRQALIYLRYSEFGASALLLLLVLLYFPAKPPNAPSISASTETLSFFKGIRQLFTKRRLNLWYIAVPSGITAGLYGVYSSLLDVNVKGIGVSQATAGWLNFSSTLGSCFAGLILGWLTDKLIGYRKLLLLLLAVAAALSCFVVVLIIGEYIPFYTYALYISYVAVGVIVNGSLPIYFETAIETTFPISEGVTMGVMTLSYNIIPFGFLLVLLDPHIGTMWMNWCMYGALVVAVPLLLLYKERYDRLSLDKDSLKTD